MTDQAPVHPPSKPAALAPYEPAVSRYDGRIYRRLGASGLTLPPISLGLWQNFGDEVSDAARRAILRRAFDLGVTHFDLANNYGQPYGSAERGFGRILATDFRHLRDELIISTKAGYDMWPGPYGEWGSRKHVLASADQSLRRLGLDYVDLFYIHRFDPATPLEETVGALEQLVRRGKALYVGVSSFSPDRTRQAAELLADSGIQLVAHQPSYSMFNRWIEHELIDTATELGVGLVTFSPLAQGLLTNRYLNGIPAGSRAARGGSLSPGMLSPDTLKHVRRLNQIATDRGQTLAQLAISWALRHPVVASVLIGVSSTEQLEANLTATQPTFTADELAEIDAHAIDFDLNLWHESSES
ncbi:aldo/keto reductase [Streptomyces hokutonensis]|uniref:aldo/keto reductase n=1 Tax=Streptomyces hokutonensis TaxID=1306990 RepID=UPI0038145595